MKKNKNSEYVLSNDEIYALVYAFRNFADILQFDVNISEDTYFTNKNISILGKDYYKTCKKLYNQYFKL